MKVKHFETEDLLATTDHIRRELGPDAVIIATRRIGTGGLIRRRPRYEIVAGIPSDDAPARRPDAAWPGPLLEAPADTSAETPAVRLALSEAALAERVAATAAARAASAPIGSDERARPARGDDGGRLAALGGRLAGIEREVSRLRERQRFHPASDLPDEATALIERLAERGLSNKLIVALAADLAAAPAEADPADTVRRGLMARLPAPRSLRVGRGSRRPIVLVGTAGSGKTTAATKLALALRGEGRRVLLATLDTVRVAGDARLLAYARALDLPARVCYGAGELAEAMSSGPLDAIVVDTPAFNAYEPQEASGFRALLNQIGPAETLLVVPAGTVAADLEAAVEYAGPGLSGLLITSADATGVPGPVLNHVVQTKLPVLYIGDRHDALQPLLAGERQTLVRLALGEPLRTRDDSHERAVERIGA